MFDKRRFRRLTANVKITHKVLKEVREDPYQDLEDTNFGITRDLGAGGLLFFWTAPLTIGSTIKLSFDLPDDSKRIECRAKVLRVHLVRGSGRYAIAVAFLDLPDEQMLRLNKYVETELEEGEGWA